MELLLKEIYLYKFRNIAERTVAFSDATTVLVGHNAAGKTNIIEAVQLLTTGSSFRVPSPSDLIQEGEEEANIKAEFEGDGRAVDVSCEIRDGRRKYQKNGKGCLPKDISGTLLSILFNPDDLAFVKQSASVRRHDIDQFGRQANESYARVLTNYSKGIEQRNHLLKEAYIDTALLDAWDDSIALGGATLLKSRASLYERIASKVGEVYKEISGGEELTAEYVCSAGVDPREYSREELNEILLEKIHDSREDDIRRQQTLIGPHRDDIAFKIAGRDARTFGSQGQQRSIVLAWKMCEVLVASEVTGAQPLLLLDDVMSELDESRREAMTSFIQTGIQTVVTTTNLGYFSKEALEEAEVVEVGAL